MLQGIDVIVFLVIVTHQVLDIPIIVKMLMNAVSFTLFFKIIETEIIFIQVIRDAWEVFAETLQVVLNVNVQMDITSVEMVENALTMMSAK